jgi:hypothetical protein
MGVPTRSSPADVTPVAWNCCTSDGLRHEGRPDGVTQTWREHGEGQPGSRKAAESEGDGTVNRTLFDRKWWPALPVPGGSDGRRGRGRDDDR